MKQEAHHEFRTYYFTIVSKEDNQVTVELYSTIYTLIKGKDGWENHSSNKNNMSAGLIGAVVQALGVMPESQPTT